MSDKKINTGIQVLFFICLAAMLWFYSQGYQNAIGWEVTTSAEVLEYPGIEIEGELLDFQVTGENYLLTERYTGGPIVRNRLMDAIFVSLMWIGLCIVLVSSSFQKRYGFMLVLAIFTLFINRLNLGEVGLFGIQTRLALVIPFIGIVGPLFYFHEYRPQTGFIVRIIPLIVVSAAIVVFGITDHSVFLDHFTGHSLFAFSIAGLLFLFILAEENVFGILSLITRGKGGKSNHLHFILLTCIYLLNLILYYLNKSGYVPNSFSFFDPYILLLLSCIISVFTLKYKAGFIKDYISENVFFSLYYGLGIMLLAVLGQSFFRGNDAVYESFHYFILYFHIGFGVFFFLYLIINFIDPLIQGLEVYKIAYREQHFPYVSARLAGLMVVLGFYFLATQEPYELLKSGYYVNLGNLEETQNKPDLADQYYRQAAFLGYNTHHSNYQLAWNYSDKGKKYLTMVHFEKAASRYPSPFAYINYTNLDIELNQSKVQATLDQAAVQFDDGEIKNNLGVLRMENEEWDLALLHFENARSGDTWNQAPLLNKWATLYKSGVVDSSALENEFEGGNFGVRSNILTSIPNTDNLSFYYEGIESAIPLHRQAYLLNAAPKFEDDSLAAKALNELEQSTDGNYNDRLRKALVIHYYKKGDVNRAFLMLDYLQSNSYQHQKGGFLNDLGKLALDQGAYRLALDFFDKAIEHDDLAARLNRLEALAFLGRGDEIKDELLGIVHNDPGLTTLANQILVNVDKVDPDKKKISEDPGKFDKLSDEQLIALATRNAFEEQHVTEAVRMLNSRDNSMGYNVILEAMELNPYSSDLLKIYVLTALRQNLVSYAEEVLPRIRELVPEAEYNAFYSTYQSHKEELDNQGW